MITAKVDDRKRVRLPQARPGQVFAIQDNGKGQITLLEVQLKARETPAPSVLDGLKPFTKAECEQAWGRGSDSESDRIAAAMCKVRIPPPAE